MKSVRKLALLVALFAVSSAFSAEWCNLDPEHRLGGRMVSKGYLRGKVVLIDFRDYGDRSCVEMAKKLQTIWVTYKMKQFAMIGSYSGSATDEKIGKIVKGLGITYSVYRDAGLEELKEPPHDGFLVVVDGMGRIRYRGRDDRAAAAVIPSALLASSTPATARGWKDLVQYELKWLPGKALNDLVDFRKTFPAEAKAFDEDYERISKSEEIKTLARLEKAVRQVKDYNPADKSAKKISVEKIAKAIEVGEPLKTSADPVIVQEAKNCIAELMWAQAARSPKKEME